MVENWVNSINYKFFLLYYINKEELFEEYQKKQNLTFL